MNICFCLASLSYHGYSQISTPILNFSFFLSNRFVPEAGGACVFIWVLPKIRGCGRLRASPTAGSTISECIPFNLRHSLSFAFAQQLPQRGSQGCFAPGYGVQGVRYICGGRSADGSTDSRPLQGCVRSSGYYLENPGLWAANGCLSGLSGDIFSWNSAI